MPQRRCSLSRVFSRHCGHPMPWTKLLILASQHTRFSCRSQHHLTCTAWIEIGWLRIYMGAVELAMPLRIREKDFFFFG